MRLATFTIFVSGFTVGISVALLVIQLVAGPAICDQRSNPRPTPTEAPR